MPETLGATTIRPYLGLCEKQKGDDHSDCKKGMVINRTLRQGDAVVKLREKYIPAEIYDDQPFSFSETNDNKQLAGKLSNSL